MLQRKLMLAVLIAVAALSGCSGDQGDDVTININSDGGGSTDGSGGGSGSSSCDKVVTADFVSFNSDCSVGTLSGVINEDYTLISDVQWRLDGFVQVGTGNQVTVTNMDDVQAIKDAGATLTIEPGTDIRAFDTGVLEITRGSRIMAEGTASSPITFSSLDDNYQGLGEWGGVILQGFAPEYGKGGTGPCFGSGDVCNVQGEGGTQVGLFGGSDQGDSSGSLKYVRIAEGGLVAGPNNEINGLTLQGVGSGTTIDYVQVANNLDDGIEWFGGTVNLTHAVLTGNDDDDIDFDEGYMGNIQYALVQKDQVKATPEGSNDPRGIEANSSDEEYVPETNAVIANVTIVGGPMENNPDALEGMQPGMRLRGALTVSIFNTSVSMFDYGCIRIDDADVNGDGSVIVPSDVNLTNILNDCQGGIYPKRAADSASNVVEATLTYSSTYAINESEAILSSAPVINAVNNGSGFVFDQTDYVGAVDPREATGWWEGWILPGTLTQTESVQPASFVSCNADETVCTLTGVIDEDYKLISSVQWRLDGFVQVGTGNQVTVTSLADVQAIKDAGVTLTIEPGTDIRAFDTGVLEVTRGSRIMAIGSAASPITFSSLDDNYDGLGEWGGVILQGFAPEYGKGGTGPCFGSGDVCNVQGEGGTQVGLFGGSDPADNSGTLRYVRITEGGLVAGPNNEINGLTLQGVGSGTDISYIHVHGNLDDGIEWFGGTVNIHHVVLTSNDDDDIDFDEGYQGNIQFAIVEKNPTNPAPQGSNDPRGIEANSSDEEYVPETNAVVANVLILGTDVNNNAASTEGAQPGMRLRGALTVSIFNTAVKNWDIGCVRIDDADVNGDGSVIVPSMVTLTNILGECSGGFYQKRAADVAVNAGDSTNTGVTVDSAYALTDPEAIVTPPTIVPVDNGSGFTFESTGYVGAVEPGTNKTDAWWYGWIIPGVL